MVITAIIWLCWTTCRCLDGWQCTHARPYSLEDICYIRTVKILLTIIIQLKHVDSFIIQDNYTFRTIKKSDSPVPNALYFMSDDLVIFMLNLFQWTRNYNCIFLSSIETKTAHMTLQMCSACAVFTRVSDHLFIFLVACLLLWQSGPTTVALGHLRSLLFDWYNWNPGLWIQRLVTDMGLNPTDKGMLHYQWAYDDCHSASPITLTPYMALPLFATRFADYAGGIRVSFI